MDEVLVYFPTQGCDYTTYFAYFTGRYNALLFIYIIIVLTRIYFTWLNFKRSIYLPYFFLISSRFSCLSFSLKEGRINLNYLITKKITEIFINLKVVYHIYSTFPCVYRLFFFSSDETWPHLCQSWIKKINLKTTSHLRSFDWTMKDRCDLYSHAHTENERYKCRNIISREGEQEKAFLENITNTKSFTRSHIPLFTTMQSLLPENCLGKIQPKVILS